MNIKLLRKNINKTDENNMIEFMLTNININGTNDVKETELLSVNR